MVDIMNTFIAILLSVIALTPIFLLVTLLNKTKVQPSGTDPLVIKRLEDMDTTIATDTNVALETVSAKLEDLETRLADLEDQRTTVSGFKNKK
jgi:hypothetical protein|tara:strand:- start:264 stop:542 length:279 start_codon:yes stop_codon:yes gene_type:complete